MVTENEYTKLLQSTNFVGHQYIDAQGSLITINALTPLGSDPRTIVGTAGAGYVNSDYHLIKYHFLTDISDFNSIITPDYYATTDREYVELPNGQDPVLDPSQIQILQSVLNPQLTDHYSNTFSDVAKITFDVGTTADSHIVIGETTNNTQTYPNQGVDEFIPAYELDESKNFGVLKHGDVWLNEEYRLGWTQTQEGTPQYHFILHEIGHALGLDHIVNIDPNLDNNKYTIMTSNPVDGMKISDINDLGTNDTVFSSTLQLLDIAAIQAIYGINWETRDENNTQYSKLTAFASTRLNEAFVYTIWDGDGTGDTIDASGYTDGVVIDLREGAFSSIGKSADSSFDNGRGVGLVIDNVAIAYKAVIENATGTNANDHLIGNKHNNTLDGRAGDDTLEGNGGSDILIGGADDDTYIIDLNDQGIDWIFDTEIGGDINTLKIIGQTPADVNLYQFGDHLIIEGTNGHIVLVDQFTGSPTLTDYKIVDTQGATLETIDLNPLTLDPSKLNRDTPLSLFNTQYENTQLFFGTQITATWDPLLIDLDGDGYEIDPSANSVYFDLDSNGYASSINWTYINSDDGWLVRDVNGNGRIDNGSELFGSDVLDGFSDLAQHDSNADGIIDASDAIWSDLLVWTDTNGDAQTLAAELHTLDSLAIQSIDVGNVQSVNTPIGNSDITHISTVTTTTGTLDIANLSLWTDTRNTVYAGDYTLDVTTLFLPDVRGYSQLKSLRDALNVDTQADTTNGTTLLEKMEAIASYSLTDLFLNYDTATTTLQEALFQWAGVVDANPTGRGSFISDARILEFFEEYYGQAFIDRNVTSTNPGAVQAQELEVVWGNKMNDFKAIVFGQLAGSQLYDNPTYKYDWTEDFLIRENQTDIYELSQSSLDALSAEAALLATVGEQEVFWVGVVDYLRAMSVGGLSGPTYVGVSTASLALLDAAIQASDLTGALDYASIEYRYQNPFGETLTGDTGGVATDDVITGTLEADTIIGKLGADTLDGGEGSNDILLGMDGDDQLFSGNGINLLWGGDGSDHLVGGSGNDILGDGRNQSSGTGEQDLLEGAAGSDTYVQLTGASNNAIFIVETSGTDYFQTQTHYSGGAFQGHIRFTLPQITLQRLGNDDLKISGDDEFGSNLNATIDNQFVDLNNLTGEGIEYLRIWDSNAASANSSWLDLKNHILTSTDQIETFGTTGDDVIHGILAGNKDDNIRGYNGHDVINGDEGNDFIDGDDGDDILSGGIGNDTIYGDNGQDVIDGGEGDDTLLGHAGNDMIYGRNGNDTIHGGTGNDLLYGEAGNDDLTAGGGVDIIYAGTGNDIVTTGGSVLVSGDNTQVFYEAGIDTINVGASFEELIISNVTDINDLVFVSRNLIDFDTTSKNNIEIYLNGVIDDTQDHIKIVETLSSSQKLNQVRVLLDDGSEQILYPSALSYTVYSSAGDDTMTYKGMYNYQHDQLFNGLDGNDTIYGGGNHDIFTGGKGDDFIDGGGQWDLFQYSNGDGHDTYVGGSDDDVLYFDSTIDVGNLTFAQSVDDLDVIVNTGVDYISLQDQFINSGDQIFERIRTDDTPDLFLVNYAQWIFGDATAQTLIGDVGGFLTDTIFGYAGNDIVYGYTGNDVLFGGDGDDFLYGGDADDAISGGNGNDKLYGDDGNDQLNGEAGVDYLYGHLGDDILNGGDGNDVLYGLENIDTLDGGTGDDYIYGGTANDLLYGADGNDKLYGEDDNDILYGDNGTDVLYGGLGNDMLTGGTGTDFLYGEGGADAFTLDNVSIDRLSDFNQSEGDTIHIADLLTGYDSATDDINDFVNLVIRNTGRTDIRVNEDGQGNDLQYVGIVFSDLTAETVDSLVASGTLIV